MPASRWPSSYRQRQQSAGVTLRPNPGLLPDSWPLVSGRQDYLVVSAVTAGIGIEVAPETI
jgi:hypothetical protein